MAKKSDDKPDKVALYEASQSRLMWRRFRKHKVAHWCLYVVGLMYFVCIFCDFFAPHDPSEMYEDYVNLPPQTVKFGLVGEEGGSKLPWLYVHPYRAERNPTTLQLVYRQDTDRRMPIDFFAEGREWKFLGLFTTNVHFFKSGGDQPIFLLGTGKLGQDVLSRVLYGGRISLLIGLTGVAIAFTLGIFLGGISGYYGGTPDLIIQRLCEMLQSIPKIPIWLAMAAAIPKEWTSLQVYFAMTIILATMGWTGMARTVRGKLLALREEDYSRAAMLVGATEARIIFVHLVPNFFSHIVASLSLAVPGMIMAETGLSFLGLGLQPPMVSWGVLLQEIRSPGVILNQPWLMMPALLVVTAVLAMNFVGEGMRDAADPYAN